MTDRDSDPATEADLDDLQVSHFLHVAASRPSRTLDGLIERLSQEDSELWLESVLQAGPTSMHGPPRSAFWEAPLALPLLSEIKQRAKESFRAAESEADRLPGIVSYYWCLAAGLAHHRTSLSGKRLEVIGGLVGELGEMVPAAWKPLFSRAFDVFEQLREAESA